jgi:uncharacterized protein (DUF2249 family)
MATILDVRAMAPKDRHSTIFETFKNLEPGGSFVLVNDHEPKPLLYQFQAEHDGEFDWWTLEQGPQVWRVSIVKRAERGHNRTITTTSDRPQEADAIGGLPGSPQGQALG